LHHDADPGRFLLVERVDEGYARWFSRELGRPQAALLVAARDGEVVGYAYGTVALRVSSSRRWSPTRPRGACFGRVASGPLCSK
jgi:hypothetical protein